MSTPNLVQLPNSGDLWRAPQRDADGNVIERADNVDISNLPSARGNLTPDQQAILMAELQRTSAGK